VVICLEQGENDLRMVQLTMQPQCHPVISCFFKIQIGLTFLVLAYPGCPGKTGVLYVYNVFSFLGRCVNYW